MSKPLQVLMLGAECTPFAKTGGLADVLGSLPSALRGRDIDVRVMLPRYRSIPDAYRTAITHREFTYCSVGWRWQYVGLGEIPHAGVPCYFIDNEYYFGREGPYGYADEPERFAFFCRAALEILPHMGFQPDVIHCHDWHTGMVCALLAAQYRDLPFYRHMHTVFTIHNLAYQGRFGAHVLSDLFTMGDEYLTSDKLEFYGGVSFLKAGLVYADKITTVSASYAQEIQTPEYGEGLDGLLRYRSDDLSGVLNGIDTITYNPSIDPLIYATYSASAMAGKRVNKLRLQHELGLAPQSDVPLLTLVSRLTSQKGIDLLVEVLHTLLELNIQLVVLGSGEPYYEALLREATYRFPGKLAVHLGFNDTLAHRIYAGGDIFLMPSHFEPCGLAQMIALRYGNIPVVRETGGLRDTVQPYNEYTDEGNGFSFAPYQASDFLYTMKRAIAFYHREDIWHRLVNRAMASDFSWDRSAGQYSTLYESLVAEDRSTPS